MQRPPIQNDIHLPYSKWSQHRADNGLIYLAHPVTGEVKWLWSRHHDPKTEHDYLVNTITGKRQWVTKENAHFCPVKPDTHTSTAPTSKIRTRPTTATNPLANSPKQTSAVHATTTHDPSRFASMPAAPAKVAAPKPHSANQKTPKYREIPAPKSLGLTADEVLMLVPNTGRRYIFNKKTKTSRWLPDRLSDVFPNETRSKSIFGKLKPSRQPSTRGNDGDDVNPQLNPKTQVPTSETEQLGNNLNTDLSEHASNTDPVAQGGHDPVAHQARQDIHPPRHLNDHLDGSQKVQLGAGGNEKDEVDEITRRLGALNTILADVSKLTTSDKYNMAKLRTLSNESPSKEQAQAGSQRLLELEEYLTQQMLKVDAVESEGNQVIRAKRKETVKAILALTEEIERLREVLSS